jgi:DNA phosphorothioation-associated DGQHR protein 1
MNEFPAIKISQPLGMFYLTALPARLLLKVCFTNQLSIDDSNNYHGNQRRLDNNRIKDIANYLKSQDAVMPGTIILAVNCTQDGKMLSPNDVENDSKRWCVKQKDTLDERVVVIKIPTEEKLAAVVDGQHRLWGFNGLPEDIRLMDLPCAIFFDLPTPQQASIFATINFNQKPVSKSQSYELFGYNLDDENEQAWSPDKLAIFLTRKLNNAVESPFRHHIKVMAQDDRVWAESIKVKQKEWRISTATVVEGILSLLTNNAKNDRNLLHSISIETRNRAVLNDGMICDDPPFRKLYISGGHDIVIFKTIINFFNAVEKLFWRDLSYGSKSLIRKTAGIQALFYVLKKLLPEQLRVMDLRQEKWESLLENACQLNWNDTMFTESSAKGKGRIQDAILVAIEKKNVDDVRDDVLKTYLKEKLNGDANA